MSFTRDARSEIRCVVAQFLLGSKMEESDKVVNFTKKDKRMRAKYLEHNPDGEAYLSHSESDFDSDAAAQEEEEGSEEHDSMPGEEERYTPRGVVLYAPNNHQE